MNVNSFPAAAVPTESEFSAEAAKKKRGRQPKNPEGPSLPTYSTPSPSIAAPSMPPLQQPSPQPGGGDSQYGHDVKRPRGRPPGSKNKIIKSGPPLIPHVIMVNTGEDVVDKLRDIARSYKRSVVVLAATGTLSTATLMQVGAQGQGVGVTLRGQFTILSISGAILQQSAGDSESASKLKPKEPNLFLSASLANPTGGVVGGTVAGVLEAIGPVTVVIGHWDAARERQEGDQEGGGTQTATPGLPSAAGQLVNAPMMPAGWMTQPHSEQEEQ